MTNKTTLKADLIKTESTNRFTVYSNRINSIDCQILHSDHKSTSRLCRITAESLYGVSFYYDGRCGRYAIYKTTPNEYGMYLVLHIERPMALLKN